METIRVFISHRFREGAAPGKAKRVAPSSRKAVAASWVVLSVRLCQDITKSPAELAATRSFTLWSLTAGLAVGLLVLLVLPRAARMLTALALMVTAFAFFAGYERLREGVRKPFLIHSHMFSNGLLVSSIDDINERGLAVHSGWVAAGDDDPAHPRQANQGVVERMGVQIREE